jgi:hypothetical protein
MRPSYQEESAHEGVGNAGRRCTRSRACSVVNTRVSHHESTGTSRHSRTQWFYGLFRALPGDRALLPPSPADTSASLTPASGCQDHTTSPSASVPFVNGTSASTASHPASVTIAIRPSSGTRRREYSSDLGIRKIRIFLQMGLDRFLPDGQISDATFALSPSLRGAQATKQSSFRSAAPKLDCFAEPVIGRALARPVGSQ